MSKSLEGLSKGELLDLARKVAEAAHAEDTPVGASGGARDPIVRKLAAVGLQDLRKEFSYREIAQMMGVSHSRIHQLEQELEGRVPDALKEKSA